MRKYIIQFLLFSILPILFLIVTTLIYADGDFDYYYLRFTTPKQQNLILGNSRAAQGIIPSILEKKLNKKFFNYSFTLNHSPYGKPYYNSISKKLDTKVKNGIYILCVDPFSISSSININGTENLSTEVMLGKMIFVNINPNLEFIIRNKLSPWQYIWPLNRPKSDQIAHLHKDGWLQVDYPWTETAYKHNLENKLIEYKQNQLNRKLSPTRMEYLKKTIALLQKHGKVYLVRIPISKEMLDIEEQIAPDFNEIMGKIATQYKISYFNFSSEFPNYQTTDGNHLYKPYAKKFSQALCDSINANKNSY
jgi:hypothetical protein